MRVSILTYMDNYRDASLICACKYGHVEAVRLLLDRGADPNILTSSINHNSNTRLIYASSYDHPEIVLLLLEYGANPNIQHTL